MRCTTRVGRWALVLCTLSSLTACTTRIGDLTILSTKNIPAEVEKIQASVEGRDCTRLILFIPIGTLNPTIDAAIDDALSDYPEADALIDLTIEQKVWTALLYTEGCVIVKGTAISSRS